MHAAVSEADLWPLCASPQKMSHQCMTCSPVGEHHPWGASSTEAASREDFMAATCLEIRMGKYEKAFHVYKWSRGKLCCKFLLHALCHIRCWSIAKLYMKAFLKSSNTSFCLHTQRLSIRSWGATNSNVNITFINGLMSPSWFIIHPSWLMKIMNARLNSGRNQFGGNSLWSWNLFPNQFWLPACVTGHNLRLCSLWLCNKPLAFVLKWRPRL